MSEKSERYRERIATEEAAKNRAWAKYLGMPLEQRSQVAAGLEALKYLLGRVPKSYRGPMATAEDCASIANVDAYLERNKITCLPTAKGTAP